MRKFLKRLLINTTGTPINPATADNQTNGNAKTQIVSTAGNVLNVNTDGQAHVVMRGHNCDNNSTTTTLSANAIYTGSGEDILDYNAMSLFVTSDVASATDGIKVQYRKDTTSTWRTSEQYTLNAEAEKWFTPPTFMGQYRCIYKNGTDTQSNFELTTTLRKVGIKWSSHNIDEPIKDEDDAELVKAVLTGKEVISGEYKNVGTYDNGVVNSMIVTPVDANAIPFSNTIYGTKVVQYDSSGNAISSKADAEGGYHLGNTIIQNILTSTGNSTTENLASGATFTGSAEETFGINGIQFFHSADQNCTVYIDQSLDNTFADSTQTITDPTSCLANNPCTRIVSSVAPYFRIRITNNGLSSTTEINSAAGMTPIINPLPRSLTEDGRLMSESTLAGRENTERHVWVNPTNELAVSPVYRMVGTNFDGSTKDPNFWTDGSLRDGTVTQDGGEIELETNTTANGLALYQSVRKSRFVAGSAQYFSGGFNFVTAGTADNTRRLGAYTLDGSLDVEDGFYFQLSGTTFSVGHCRAGTPTLVNSGDFNGNYGVTWTPTSDTYYSLAIEFTPLGAFWYVNGKLLHKVKQAHMSDFMTLPITLENENTGDSTTDVTLDCVGAYIARQGEMVTNPTSRSVSGESVTVCKYGAGILKGLIISAVVNGADINVYDGTAITDPLIWGSGNLAAKTEPFNIDFYDTPFSDGLTLEIADSSANVFLAYE